MAEPFLGVPKGMPCVETPDGVFREDGSHSLYDTGLLPSPMIPGDFDINRTVDDSSLSRAPYRKG